MDNKNESWYSMELTLRDYLNQNAAKTAALPGFDGFFKQFSDNIAQIQVIREEIEADKTGITDTKKLLQQELVAKALNISRKMAVYAQLVQNAVLYKEIRFSESELSRSPGARLIDRALLIHDKALEHLAELEPYGVSADALSALKADIERFNTALPLTRLGITEKRKGFNQLKMLFKANDVLLRKFDLLMELMRAEQPLFYAAYRNNRKVIYTGKGSLALHASVTDAATRSGLPGVKVRLELQDGNLKLISEKNGKPMVKMTADKGKFRVKSLVAGTYQVTLSKPGYREKVVPVTVSDKETTRLNVELERI